MIWYPTKPFKAHWKQVISLLVSSLKSVLGPSEEGSVNKCVMLHTAIARLSEITGSDVLSGPETGTVSAATRAPSPAPILQHECKPAYKKGHTPCCFLHGPSTYSCLHHLLVWITWWTQKWTKLRYFEGTGKLLWDVSLYLFLEQWVAGTMATQLLHMSEKIVQNPPNTAIKQKIHQHKCDISSCVTQQRVCELWFGGHVKVKRQ